MQIYDYLALIPGPNQNQPVFMSWMAANLQPLADLQALYASFPTAFNINTAVGPQLDIIGQTLGLPRQVDFIPDGGISSVLTDDLYRLCLKAQILKNTWKGTIQEIYDFWELNLPGIIPLIQDNQDMTISVIIVGMSNDSLGVPIFGLDTETATIKGLDEGYMDTYQGIHRNLVRNGYLVPNPAGVKIFYSFMENPVFALDSDTGLLQGLDVGYIASF